MAHRPVGVGTSLATSATSAMTTSFVVQSDVLRIVAVTAGAFVAIGTNPIATISDYYIPAGSSATLAVTKASNRVVGVTTGTTTIIDKYSAGCQVFENAEEFGKFMDMARKHKDLYGNNFTYTLIDERAYTRALKRKGTYLIAGLIIGTAIYVAYRLYKNKPIIP